MTPCKTACGGFTSRSAVICIACDEAWTASPEFARAKEIATTSPATYKERAPVALLDFCTRMRLERQNGAKT